MGNRGKVKKVTRAEIIVHHLDITAVSSMCSESPIPAAILSMPEDTWGRLEGTYYLFWDNKQSQLGCLEPQQGWGYGKYHLWVGQLVKSHMGCNAGHTRLQWRKMTPYSFIMPWSFYYSGCPREAPSSWTRVSKLVRRKKRTKPFLSLICPPIRSCGKHLLNAYNIPGPGDSNIYRVCGREIRKEAFLSDIRVSQKPLK